MIFRVADRQCLAKSSKTDKVTTFELSGCLDGRALQGFFPQDIAGIEFAHLDCG
jgi:hypothetical protein